ncbi:hypothetical protein [Swingsia samuiensis]|uniref:Lipoprotein n=1 Tax=Swingsia samuiensis TaxID=1293412 RepID=A0A4Y6UG52_9PROT|nr:hypothetical protein [Swingsia samuiensis]QDH16529.1 hypothetical protein E3D00_02275 [Swingsia samuiensis]
MNSRLYPLATALLLASTPFITGCNLVDQRTFNPNAGKPPQPYIPPAPPAPPAKPPFLRIEAGTSEHDYAPIIKRAVKAALERKENVLFLVQARVPVQADPAAQAKALTQATQFELEPVAHQINAAGAQPIQIEMQAITDPNTSHDFIQVDLR